MTMSRYGKEPIEPDHISYGLTMSYECDMLMIIWWMRWIMKDWCLVVWLT